MACELLEEKKVLLSDRQTKDRPQDHQPGPPTVQTLEQRAEELFIFDGVNDRFPADSLLKDRQGLKLAPVAPLLALWQDWFFRLSLAHLVPLWPFSVTHRRASHCR
jgi:hypothetical protein